jgi:hypothetical protein
VGSFAAVNELQSIEKEIKMICDKPTISKSLIRAVVEKSIGPEGQWGSGEPQK